MGLLQNIQELQNIAELARGDPAPETGDSMDDGSTGFFSVTESGDITRTTPDSNNLEKYWRYYKNEPLVRIPIRRFADDVTNPGYKIDAEDSQLVDDLERALEDSVIIAGESGHDFRELLHAAIVQREVRGTAMIELVPRQGQRDDPNSMWGFRPINVGTVSGLTYPNKSILVEPDDMDADTPTTPRNEKAAYVQFHEDALLGPFDDHDPVPLSQNDIVKLTTDADTSDIFGTSRIESVAHEIEGFRQIKRDNEEAIAAKAYPHWIIKAGSPDAELNAAGRVAGMWPEEKMKQLRSAHSKDNFEPGQKDIVPGDVDIEKVSGETADIEYVIKHYVEHILAAMPTPKYAIGFSDDINRDVTGPQSEDYQRLVERTRRSLEDAFQPALQRKARDLGYDESVASTVSMQVAPAREKSPLEDDSFRVSEFQNLMQGLATARSVAGDKTIMTRDEIRTRVLGLEEWENVPDELRDSIDNPEDATTENADETGDEQEN